jgi:hypothetical protein
MDNNIEFCCGDFNKFCKDGGIASTVQVVKLHNIMDCSFFYLFIYVDNMLINTKIMLDIKKLKS